MNFTSPVLKYRVGESAFPEFAMPSLVSDYIAGFEWLITSNVSDYIAGAICFLKSSAMLGCCGGLLSRRFILRRRVVRMNITRPNQSLLPTPMSVTIRADARLAPAIVAADL